MAMQTTYIAPGAYDVSTYAIIKLVVRDEVLASQAADPAGKGKTQHGKALAATVTAVLKQRKITLAK